LRWALPVGLVLATLLTFSPGLRNDFVNWDDDVNIVQNHAFRGFDGPRLQWMFTTFLGGHYQPLTWISFAVDHAIYGGANSFGFHFTNLVLHAVGAALFFFVALRLLQWVFDPPESGPNGVTYWCAAFAAAVFALHPLRVESVSWVTERRDVLSGVLLFACLLTYCRALVRPGQFAGWFVLSLAFFILSLLSKAAALSLPVVLLVIDIYPARRLRNGSATIGRLIVEKVPFLLLSVAAGVMAIYAQRDAGAMKPLAEIDVLSRVAMAGYGYVFYVYKTLVPLRLSPLYPIPPRAQLLGTMFIISAVLLVVAVVLAIAFRRRYPAFLAVIAAYLALLAPVSGIMQSGKQLVADRYSYLSVLPLAVLLAGGLLWLHRRPKVSVGDNREARTFSVLAGVYIFAIVLLTAYQTTVWKDSVSLWDSAVRADNRNSVAHVNLADALREDGHPDGAIIHYMNAINLDPQDDKARAGLGRMLLELKEPAGALEQFQAAVDLAPDNPQYRFNLAYVLVGLGRLEEGADQYGAALKLAPRFSRAVEAVGPVLVELGRYPEAKQTMLGALPFAPPDSALRGSLAWLLATCPDDAVRDGELAVELAEELCRQTEYNDPRAVDTLAAAYAEAGRFDEALRHARAALVRAEVLGEKDLATQLRERVQLYASKTPWRDE
jgi:tetratricopeptide (TPR) repeat protein